MAQSSPFLSLHSPLLQYAFTFLPSEPLFLWKSISGLTGLGNAVISSSRPRQSTPTFRFCCIAKIWTSHHVCIIISIDLSHKFTMQEGKNVIKLNNLFFAKWNLKCFYYTHTTDSLYRDDISMKTAHNIQCRKSRNILLRLSISHLSISHTSPVLEWSQSSYGNGAKADADKSCLETVIKYCLQINSFAMLTVTIQQCDIMIQPMSCLSWS